MGKRSTLIKAFPHWVDVIVILGGIGMILVRYQTFSQHNLPHDGWLLAAALAALLSYMCKGIRLYLILLGKWRDMPQFTMVYTETTLINLAYPIKLGEFYRIYKVADKTKKISLGIAAVLIDRFFDTIPLLVVFFAFVITSGGLVPTIVLLVTAVFAMLLLLYWIYPFFYSYLNHYIIISTATPFKLKVLKGLDICITWHSSIQSLVSGRGILLLFLSSVAWGMECLALMALGQGAQQSFSILVFVQYLQDGFVGKENSFAQAYLLLGIGLSILFVLLFRVMVRKERKKT